jgi:rod shape-determining protein MreC
METSRISVFYRGLIVLAGVLLLQLLMLGYQLRTQSDIPLIRFGTAMIVEPVHRAMSATSEAVHGVWAGYLDLRGVREENRSLNSDLHELKLENQRLKAETTEIRRLRGLLDLKALVPAETVAARVLGGSAGETSRLLMIDKGANAGIRPDAPVIVPDGVVGKVLAVFPDSAQVILLTDPFSGAGVLLEENRMHGVLKGRNDALLQLDFIPNGERLSAGQRVFTSGEDKIYPPGLAVGIVESTAPGARFQDIIVRPLAPLQSLEEVLVILRTDFVLPLPEPKRLGPDMPGPPPAGSAPASGTAPQAITPSSAPRPAAPAGTSAPSATPPAGAAPAGAPAAARPAPATTAPATAPAPQPGTGNTPANPAPVPTATSAPTSGQVAPPASP